MSAPPADLVAFCEREHPRLVGALSLYCGDADVAEDLAQDALAKACVRWEQVRDMSAPGAWVHRVAMNAANSRWRRLAAARRARVRLAGSRADETHEDRDVVGDLALREAVAGLPERQRRALVLRYVLDLSAESAAKVMGVSEQAVRNLTHRAVAQLRTSFVVDALEAPDAP